MATPLTTPVEVRMDADGLVCDLGPVGECRTEVHEPHCGRPCAHLLLPVPPAVILIGRAWAAALNFQLRVGAASGPTPGLAARRGGVLIVAWDRIGPVTGCRGGPTGQGAADPDRQWRYRLWEMRWWDEDTPSAGLLLGALENG